MPLVASGQFTITDSADNINMILSSDSFIVATNSDGSNGNYSNCVCRLKVLQGFLDETSKWTFSVGTPVGLTGVLSSDTYTVSGATLDSSTVDITATRSGYPSITKRLTVVKAKAGAIGATGENFVINYATSELWTTDSSNTQALGKYGGNFTVNGEGNQRVWSTDPFGRPALTWRTVGNDATSDNDGGWDKSVTGLDPEKSYMSVVYVRRLSASTDGRFYHGCGKSGSTITVEGLASSNPYFANGIGLSSFDTLDWYVSIGFIKANADGSASSTQGGLYKLSTGAKVSAYSDFRMAAGATTQSHRTYLYYSTDPSASLEWWGPGFFEINGNEPKLRDLVGNPEWYNGNIALGSDGTLSGGGGGKVTIGGLGYTGALDANKTSVDAGGALQGVASGVGTVVSNAQIGINASGELYGTGTALTKVSNNQIYVDTSGAIQGISSTSSGLSVANNTDNVIRAPEGGVYTTRTSTITGRLKIALPQSWSNTMMRFTVEIYEYIAGYMCTLEIGGYNNETNGWVHVTARVIGGSNVEYPVYFGHDDSKCCIWVGSAANETWAYPQVRIRDFFAAYANVARTKWESGWVISFDQTAITSGTGANQYSASVLDTLPGADWAKVSGANKPANNATVGATWGTNVSSIPSNISTAGSTPTIDLRNNQIGLNASGQLYGAGAGNGTTVSNAQISVDTATGVIGGIGTGAGTAVANSQVAFSARQTWEFRGSAEGWITTNASIAANADTITLTATAGNPQLGLVGLNINGATYDKVRVRIRRVAGSGWRGTLFYGTATHSSSELYKKVLLDSVASASFVVIEFDMANLTAGGVDWKSNTITQLRFDLGNVTGDAFEIDWISVGKYGHDVDLVLSASSQIIAGTETNGVILDAASKSLQVVTGGNERVRLGNQAAAVNGSAYGFVVKDNGGNVVFDSRNAVGIVGNQAHDNYNLGDSTTNPFWNTNTNGVGNVSIGALALRGDGLAEASGRSYNVAIGYQALRYTTVGTNIAIGYQAGRGNPAGFSGGDNTVIGYNAMVNGTTANKNVAIGRGALRDTTSGSENTAVGYLSQTTGDIASYNTSLGFLSLRVATGSENTSVGHNSGYSLNTGSNNTFVGKDAGYTITTGSGNTFIGYKAYTDANQNNQTIIASGAGVVLKHSGSLLETSHNFSSGGNITATGTVKGGAITVEGSGPTIRLLDTDAAQSNFWIHANSSKFYVLSDYDYDGNWDTLYPLVLDNATTTANIYGSKVWTAGNDGTDSGLDADLLDGQQGSYYLSWANFTGKPTTLSGYGITDAASSSHAHTYASLSSKPTSPQGFSMVPEEMPAGIDLDTKTATGWYSQANTNEATTALHYPVARAGLLEVFAYSTMVHQRYWIYSSNDVYQRTKYSTNAWNGWVKIANVDDNVATATKLAASKTINGVAFDGSANITVADSTKLPLSGGTMTGAIAFAAAQTWPTFNQSTTGSAASLTTGRTLTIGSTGKAFNGTANVSWTLAEIGAAPATHSHTVPVSGAWFNGGYMSIRSDGVMQAGKYLDWHNATTDTTGTSRTTVDSTGLLTHSEGIKVKGTGGLGYAFGGVVTQLTSRDTGVTLNTPSGRITLASVAVTAGTRNKFTLTNSCIAATDVVVVSMQAPGAGTFVVSVNRVAAGSCDIVIQNLDTITAAAPSLNFAIIKGANA